jgi:hypothetical protein
MLDSLVVQCPYLASSVPHSLIGLSRRDRNLFACGSEPFQDLTLSEQFVSNQKLRHPNPNVRGPCGGLNPVQPRFAPFQPSRRAHRGKTTPGADKKQSDPQVREPL